MALRNCHLAHVHRDFWHLCSYKPTHFLPWPTWLFGHCNYLLADGVYFASQFTEEKPELKFHAPKVNSYLSAFRELVVFFSSLRNGFTAV